MPLLSFQGILYSQTRVVDVFAGLLSPRLDYVNFSLRVYLNSRAAVVFHICVVIFEYCFHLQGFLRWCCITILHMTWDCMLFIKNFNLLVFLCNCIYCMCAVFIFKACYGFRLWKFSFPSAGHDSRFWVVTGSLIKVSLCTLANYIYIIYI